MVTQIISWSFLNVLKSSIIMVWKKKASACNLLKTENCICIDQVDKSEIKYSVTSMNQGISHKQDQEMTFNNPFFN